MKRRKFLKAGLPATALLISQPNSIPLPATAIGSRSITIAIYDGAISATDERGNVVATGNEQTGAHRVIQQSIDVLETGGQVRLLTGDYYLTDTLVIFNNTRLTGEGRRTILVPPPGKFAIKVIKTARSLVSRRMLNPPWMNSVLYGVTLDNFSIEGKLDNKPANGEIFSGNGKGIFIDEVSDFTIRDLWIVDTHDGAGLYLGSSGSKKAAREGIVDTVHFVRNGNPKAGEAAIVVAGLCNNIHFSKIFVLYPNYIGLEAGVGDPDYPPRLLFLSHSMFHGMLPETDVHPFDLIKITKLDAGRGMTIRDTRLTHCGNNNSYLHVVEGDVKISGCIMGGGSGGHAIKAERRADVTITANSFHPFGSTKDSNYALLATGAAVKFNDNIVYAEGGQIRLVSVRNSVVSNNSFEMDEMRPSVVINEEDGPAAQVVLVQNFFNRSSKPRALAITKKVLERDNFFDLNS